MRNRKHEHTCSNTYYDYIRKEVRQIKNKHKLHDASDLCQAMKIKLRFEPLGNTPESCKGFYMVQSRIHMIVINDCLSEILKRCILAHELGHAVLHKDIATIKAFHDFSIIDSTTKFEFEANVFAAEFLLDDTAVFRLLDEEISFFDAAAILEVPPELLAFKIRLINRQGYKIDSPYTASGDFLRKIN